MKKLDTFLHVGLVHVLSFLIFYFNLLQQILVLFKNQSSIFFQVLPIYKISMYSSVKQKKFCICNALLLTTLKKFKDITLISIKDWRLPVIHIHRVFCLNSFKLFLKLLIFCHNVLSLKLKFVNFHLKKIHVLTLMTIGTSTCRIGSLIWYAINPIVIKTCLISLDDLFPLFQSVIIGQEEGWQVLRVYLKTTNQVKQQIF